MSLKIPRRIGVQTLERCARARQFFPCFRAHHAKPNLPQGASSFREVALHRSCTLAHSSIRRCPIMAPPKPTSDPSGGDKRETDDVSGAARPAGGDFPPQIDALAADASDFEEDGNE